MTAFPVFILLSEFNALLEVIEVNASLEVIDDSFCGCYLLFFRQRLSFLILHSKYSHATSGCQSRQECCESGY